MESQNSFSTIDLIRKGSETSGYNRAKAVQNMIALVIVCLLAFGFYKYILPTLIAMVWGTVQLIVGGVLALLILSFCIAERKNWKILNEVIASKLFGRLIQEAPFLMQERQIRKAEQDYETMMQEKSKLDGKYQELSAKLKSNENDYNEAVAGEALARKSNDNDLVGSQMAKQARASRYIQSIKPIVENMGQLVQFVNLGSRVMKRKIADAKADLAQNRDIFESAKTGAAALDHMKRAMVGDVELNSDAERAQMEVMRSIALSVGQMRTSMEIISDITKEANLQDASKLAVAKQKLESLNIVDASQIPASGPGLLNLSDIKMIQSDNEFPI